MLDWTYWTTQSDLGLAHVNYKKKLEPRCHAADITGFLLLFQQKENFGNTRVKNWWWEWFMIKVYGFLLPLYSFYPSDRDDPFIWTLSFFWEMSLL